jgi:hypothetical protein
MGAIFQDRLAGWLSVVTYFDFDFDLTELVQGQLQVSRKLEEWVQKNF